MKLRTMLPKWKRDALSRYVTQKLDDGVEAVNASGQVAANPVRGDHTFAQRGAPSTDELASGERMLYVSDGEDDFNAGELVAARNNDGTITSQAVAANTDDSSGS